MSTAKLFVGNIEYTTTEQQLTDLFASAGTVVSAKIITHRDTGRSKGFGFVEMGSADEAAAAMETLNGKELNGRALAISEARPQQPREDRRW